MDQPQEQGPPGPFHALYLAAKETTTVFRYSRSLWLIWPTLEDVEVIIDADPNGARGLLLQAGSGFSLTMANKLFFTTGTQRIIVELLRAGSTCYLRFPDVMTISLLTLTVSGRPMCVGKTPIISKSARPRRIEKAATDMEDVEELLNWLARDGVKVNFEGYPKEAENYLLSAVRKLYQMKAFIRPLLRATLEEEHFRFVSN
ncbi:hypothetical protein N7509_009153 [Penicillium cosmopolitanum]|uniref:Uncharacterized protein n=1 Tax=Penicillium cosmopolitanum TaxID=1131564 RepID=A0A9W9VNX8_9EURO|nr:uncharacterized protein N7509_009153 [Penicillium cosmopolitanum]KAJ5386612.1 hypothetical protein N7509_009153 [Penicillium cosmopolitanum]